MRCVFFWLEDFAEYLFETALFTLSMSCWLLPMEQFICLFKCPLDLGRHGPFFSKQGSISFFFFFSDFGAPRLIGNPYNGYINSPTIGLMTIPYHFRILGQHNPCSKTFQHPGNFHIPALKEGRGSNMKRKGAKHPHIKKKTRLTFPDTNIFETKFRDFCCNQAFPKYLETIIIFFLKRGMNLRHATC